jgi:hypothetical protein
VRRSLALVLVAAAAAVGPAGQGAAAPRATSVRIEGVEIAATRTAGTFVGKGDGLDAVVWKAVVRHRPLSGRTPVAVTGGAFAIALRTRRLTGTLAGGRIALATSDRGCGRQRYDVTGRLERVGGAGTGSLAARLTHHRKRLLGRCITYAATVTGTVVLPPVEG